MSASLPNKTSESSESGGELAAQAAQAHHGKLVATCANDGLVRLWTQKGTSVAGVAQFSGMSPCLSMAFLSPRVLLCGFEDGCIRCVRQKKYLVARYLYTTFWIQI